MKYEVYFASLSSDHVRDKVSNSDRYHHFRVGFCSALCFHLTDLGSWLLCGRISCEGFGDSVQTVMEICVLLSTTASETTADPPRFFRDFFC